MEEECPHGMGDRAWCVICNGRVAEDEKRVTVKYMFKARYSNYMHNDSCDHWIDEGESIHVLSDGKFVCGDCAEGFD